MKSSVGSVPPTNLGAGEQHRWWVPHYSKSPLTRSGCSPAHSNMDYLTFFERDTLHFVYQFLAIVTPKTDDERDLEAVAKSLVKRVESMQAQRKLLNEQYELHLRPGFSEAEAIEVPDSGGGAG